MENNKLIIAAAGSGKTKTLVEEALKIENQNVLITTFTESNEREIKNRITQKTKGYIPSNIITQTWFSFLLQHGVRPFQDIMNDDLWDKKVGFYLKSGSSSVYKGKDGNTYSKSEGEQFFQYYFLSKDCLKINSDKVSEFTCKCNKKTNGSVINRISNIFPHIFIDEVQDLAGYDLEILKLLFNIQSRILLVGDPRQGIYSTNNSRKNNKYKKSQIIHFFEDTQIKSNLEIDDTSLVINYRSNQSICDISNKLFPDYPNINSGQTKKTNHDGVFLVQETDICEYLDKYNCTQLRWDIRQNVNPNFPVSTFGDSKGLDFDRVLIYPTNPIKKWLLNHSNELPNTSRSKFYVALTRARHSVGIVYNYNDNKVINGINKYK